MADTENPNTESPKRITRRQAAKLAEKAVVEEDPPNNNTDNIEITADNIESNGDKQVGEGGAVDKIIDKPSDDLAMDTDEIARSTDKEILPDTNISNDNVTTEVVNKDKISDDQNKTDITNVDKENAPNTMETDIANFDKENAPNTMETDIAAVDKENTPNTMETDIAAVDKENAPNTNDKSPSVGEAMETDDNTNNQTLDQNGGPENDKSQTENGYATNETSVPELEADQTIQGSPSKPTLKLTPKTKIKLNIIPKEDNDIVEVPVVKPKIDVIDVPDEEGVGDTEVVSEDELPPPPSKEKVDGAEEVSDEELPAGPKPANPPEGAEEVSDEELPAAPKPDTPPEGAEEVSDEELPAAPKPELPPEAEDVSDEELQEIKSKSDGPATPSKSKPASKTVTVTIDDEEPVSKETQECLFPTKEDVATTKKRGREEGETKEGAKKPRPASPEKVVPKKLTELEQYWKAVKENPSDFTGWTHLLKHVDQESDVKVAEEAYSTFLAQYPYCYGYWRKYADYERKRGTQAKCEQVFNEGLEAIPLSVDLWIHFLTYVKSVFVEDPDYIRKQYERCVNTCGLEFRADSLWDSYIKWEIAQKQLMNAMNLYDRVLKVPLHGNSNHFDSFQTFVASNSPKDILAPEVFLSLRKELLSLKKDINKEESEDKPPGDEDYKPPEESVSEKLEPEELNALREKIVLSRKKIHKDVAAAVAERRPFEEAIKRPYFHVKALEKIQLKNWKDYLDFEVKKGDETRIEVLFERCLIACALYEEFWDKYIEYLRERSADCDKIGSIFHRACAVHNKKKVNLHFKWASWEEVRGNGEKAQEILANIEKQHPQLVEISFRRIALEKRRKQKDSVCLLYEGYLKQWSEEKDKQKYFDLAVKYARYLTIVLKDPPKGITVIQNAIAVENGKETRNLQNFTRLNFQLIDLHLHCDKVDITTVVSYLDDMLDKETLSLDQKLHLVTKKVELLEEYGEDIVVIERAIEHFRGLAKQSKNAQESRKPASQPVPVLEVKEKKEIPTQIISAVRKSKTNTEPPPTPAIPPPPQNVFYPGPPSQAQFIPQGQYPPQYTTTSLPPPPPNFSGPYPMDPNAPMMYPPSPYPVYGGPPNAPFSGNWPPGNYGPGAFQSMNQPPPPNQRRY